MRSLLDVNVLIALFDPDHVFHERAHAWLASHAAMGIATCPLTENGLVRVLTHPGYSKKKRFHPHDIIARLHGFVQRHDHEFWNDSLSLRDRKSFRAGRILGSKQITDIYLLALVVAHKARLATFDSAIPLEVVPSAKTDSLVVI